MLINYIKQAYSRQISYKGSADFGNQDIKSIALYINEELNEILRCLTEGPDRYKPFKPEAPINKEELANEIADLLIHSFNLAAVSGLPPEVIEEAFKAKLKYNQTRVDHLVNCHTDTE